VESPRKIAPVPPEPAAANDPRLLALARLVGIVDRLRAPDGCPWDRKQTLATMAPCLVEEAYETVEAIDLGRDPETAEEAGDVLMVVALICRIAQDENRFDLSTAADSIAEKLIRRHPHVFGDVRADSPEAALRSWESVKKSERGNMKTDASALAGVPAALPALQRARRVCEKVVAAGFRWSSAQGAIEKLAEEHAELSEALAGLDLERDSDALGPLVDPERRARVEHELGDVLLSAAFAAAYLELDPEKLCRDAVRRFELRFREMESGLAKAISEHTRGELLAAWNRAKAAGR
jgi:MazG family protein